MSTKGFRINVLLMFLLFVASGFVGRAVAQETWEFDAAIYAWVPNIDVELPTGQKSKITRNDILENLDFTFMGRFFARRNNWSVGTDFLYFDLSHKGDDPIGRFLELREIELQSYLITPSVGYRVLESENGWTETFAGVRFLSLETSLEIRTVDPLPPESNKDSETDQRWDGILGVRGVYNLGERWFIPYSADVGTGESDYVYSLFGGIGYRFGGVDAVAGWRYMDYDFGDNWVLKTMTINGPLVGVAFSF